MKQRGMSLMELLVVMVIVGIISAIAIPGYRQYAMRTHRTDAKVALTSRAAGLERCFTRYPAYNSPDCTAATSLPETVESGRFDFEQYLIWANGGLGEVGVLDLIEVAVLLEGDSFHGKRE